MMVVALWPYCPPYNLSKLSINMNPETIVKEAKESLTNFCLEECKALCCRKGFLVLKPDQVELVTQNRKEELIE